MKVRFVITLIDEYGIVFEEVKNEMYYVGLWSRARAGARSRWKNGFYPERERNRSMEIFSAPLLRLNIKLKK